MQWRMRRQLGRLKGKKDDIKTIHMGVKLWGVCEMVRCNVVYWNYGKAFANAGVGLCPHPEGLTHNALYKSQRVVELEYV